MDNFNKALEKYGLNYYQYAIVCSISDICISTIFMKMVPILKENSLKVRKCLIKQ